MKTLHVDSPLVLSNDLKATDEYQIHGRKTAIFLFAVTWFVSNQV